MFGSLGVPELLMIFAVILIVFGPRRIPEIGRTLGKALGEFRKATDDLKSTIEREVRLEELKKITPPSLESFMTPSESISRNEPPVGGSSEVVGSSEVLGGENSTATANASATDSPRNPEELRGTEELRTEELRGTEDLRTEELTAGELKA